MFQIHSSKIQYYFKLMRQFSIFGHLPIVSICVFDNNNYAITANNVYEHAEEILCKMYRHSKIQAIFTNLEPCCSCAFFIYRLNISYIFFGNYQLHSNSILSNITYRKIHIYGGLYQNNDLTSYFNLLR